ncbi:MAG: hypothetical protein L0I76_26905 [Pseudonocardia sp.]|nr:hypothetical protein [Pseudonocardia sp.]
MNDTPIVAHNRFPTRVTAPDGGAVKDARTVITCPQGGQPARLMVWLHPGEPLVNEHLHLDQSTIRSPRQAWYLVTPAGGYQVEAGSGCGCHHPLKRFSPFTPMRMGALPT